METPHMGAAMALDGYSDLRMSRQAMKAELLDAETETALARAWAQDRDAAALHRLITAYMRLAVSMALKFRRYGAPLNDLIQEANLGLMKAAEKFDPERGVRFSTYAVWWIKAGIQDHVMRNWSLVRTGSTASQKSLFFNMRRVQARLTREAADLGETLDAAQLQARVALDLGVSLADVQMMEGRLAGADFSLNAVQGGDAEGREWIEALEDDSPGAADQVGASHDQAQLRRWLAAALDDLSPRERYIVTQRRLLDDARTLESLGAELGLSKERIRQLESAALARLRHMLEARAPEARALL